MVVAGVLYSSGDTALVVASDPIPPLPIELHDDSTARAEYRRQVDERYASLRARDEAIGGRVSAGMRRIFDVLPIAVGVVMVPFLAIMLRIGTHGQGRSSWTPGHRRDDVPRPLQDRRRERMEDRVHPLGCLARGLLDPPPEHLHERGREHPR